VLLNLIDIRFGLKEEHFPSPFKKFRFIERDKFIEMPYFKTTICMDFDLESLEKPKNPSEARIVSCT